MIEMFRVCNCLVRTPGIITTFAHVQADIATSQLPSRDSIVRYHYCKLNSSFRSVKNRNVHHKIGKIPFN